MQRFAVLGLGRFGMSLARQLHAAGQEVIAVDSDLELIEHIRDEVTLAVAMNCTDEAALKAHKVDEVDVAIVSIGDDFEAATLATVMLKQLGVKRVISRAVSPMLARILTRIGADEVVNPEDESADRWAARLVMSHFLNQVVLGHDFSVVELITPEQWVGKTLIELDLRRSANVNLVAIKSHEQVVGSPDRWQTRLPGVDEPLKADDSLVIVGSDEDLARLPG